MLIKQLLGMELLFGKKSIFSKVDPSAVCGEHVGCNSIQYTRCRNEMG